MNVIAPGAIDTPMIAAAQMPKEAMNEIRTRVPLKRIGKSEEISAAVIFLASEEASYITGVTLYVAASDLMPEVNREPGVRISVVVFIGVALLFVIHRLFQF